MLTKEIQTGTFIVREAMAHNLALSVYRNLQRDEQPPKEATDKNQNTALFGQADEKNIIIINIDGVMQKYTSWDWFDGYVRGIVSVRIQNINSVRADN